MLANTVLDAIGNTPLLRPGKISSGKVFAKAEFLNPGSPGSGGFWVTFLPHKKATSPDTVCIVTTQRNKNTSVRNPV